LVQRLVDDAERTASEMSREDHTVETMEPGHPGEEEIERTKSRRKCAKRKRRTAKV
jgi:hypothetical protein